MAKRVRLEDIAAASGSSIASVSLALRNQPGVSRSRREHIMAKAIELGYDRSLNHEPATEPATMISLLVRAGERYPILDRFYSWVLTGVQDACSVYDMTAVLGAIPTVQEVGDGPIVPSAIQRSRSSAWVVLGNLPMDYLQRLQAEATTANVPLVLIDSSAQGVTADAVVTANEEAGRDATRYLIERGHRAIAFVGEIENGIPSFDERFDGYREAMRSAGLKPRVTHTVTDDDEVFDQGSLERLDFTALFCQNDRTAVRATRQLQLAGYDVPGDVSLIGVDGTEDGEEMSPPLTTMAIDMSTMGRAGISLLHHRLLFPNDSHMTVRLTTQLVERNSVRTFTTNP